MNPASDFGNGLAQNAQDTGNKAINSFDPSGTATKQQQNTNSLFGTQQAQTNNYINDYSKAVANNPTVGSLYDQANQQFNVPGLAKTANYLQNTVNNAIPDAYQGARGYDIDSTDINNGIASKLGYLTPQMNAATNNLNTAQGLAQQKVAAGQTQNAQNLMPVQAEQQNLLAQQAAQATGWNNASQNEFQGLINKMQAGVTLSGQEMDRANQLAAQETSYQNQQSANNASIQAAKLNNQYKDVGQNSNLFNTLTGTMVNPTISNPYGLKTYG